jgi:hypothetical protein
MRFLRTCPVPASLATHCSIVRVFVILLACLAGSLTSHAGAQTRSAVEPTWYLVVDRANFFDEEQERAAIDDAWRLNMLGIPTQVVTELEESTPELARQRADRLRIEDGIESAPGADDGMVIYAAVHPANRSIVHIAVATGAGTLPSGGLAGDELAAIVSTIVVPQMVAGDPPLAIVHSMREMIYQQVFTPPPGSTPKGSRAALQGIIPWLAPALAIPVAVVTIRGAQARRGRTMALLLAVPPLGVGLLLAVAAVVGRSGPGVFWATGLMLVGVGVLIVADRELQRGQRRVLSMTPRRVRHDGAAIETGS